MKVKRAKKDEFSIRVPLDVCNTNNAEFDGDEEWMYKMVSDDTISEMEQAWGRILVDEGRTSIHSKVVDIINKSASDPLIDPAMYMTMPLEVMIDHSGGEVYRLETWISAAGYGDSISHLCVARFASS